MAVYVGVPMWEFGRMIMCHMVADTEEELDEMAAKIGMKPAWKQIPNRPPGRISAIIHYDVALSKRKLAISLGAIALDTMEEEVEVLQRIADG